MRKCVECGSILFPSQVPICDECKQEALFYKIDMLGNLKEKAEVKKGDKRTIKS